MDFLSELWLPIVLSAVFVFVVSSIIHMAFHAWHAPDHKGLPGEDKIAAAMREQNISPGGYMIPHCKDFAEAQKPENQEKWNQGPVVMMTVLPNGMPGMGKSLLQWFIYCLGVGVFVAYLGDLGLLPGAEYMAVFRFTGTVAFLGYGFGAVIDSIWKGVSWTTSMKFWVDGMLYALTTAGTFAWLWPDLL